MDELWVVSAHINHLVHKVLWVLLESINRMLIREHTESLFELEYSQIRLSRHQQTILSAYGEETEPKEVQRDLHEVRGIARHESDDRV